MIIDIPNRKLHMSPRALVVRLCKGAQRTILYFAAHASPRGSDPISQHPFCFERGQQGTYTQLVLANGITAPVTVVLMVTWWSW